jgi:hypothetical protein
MLYYFASNKSKKISLKTFETFNQLREFINIGYKFENLSNEEKLIFCQFLIQCSDGILNNCKMTNISVTNYSGNKDISSLEEIAIENKDTMDDFEITVNDYRSSAEDFFYNIYTIFSYNFEKEGMDYFFNWLYKILENSDIQNQNIIYDKNKLYTAESVIFTVRSILDCFDSNEENQIQYILKFINIILNSQLLQTQEMLICFLLFLDQASPIIAKDEKTFVSIIGILINIIQKSPELVNIASYVLVVITDFAKNFSFTNFEIFKELYNFFSENFTNLSNNTILNIVESLCSLAVVSTNNSEEIINLLIAILNQVKIKLSNSSDKNEIKSCFLIYLKVLKRSNQNTVKEIFERYMTDTYSLQDKILDLFEDDTNLILDYIKVFMNLFTKMKIVTLDYFDFINNQMINLLTKNSEFYNCLRVLELFYMDIISVSSDKKILIENNLFYLCEMIMETIIKHSKKQIELIEYFAQFLSAMIINLNFDKNYKNNKNIFDKIVSLFLDAIRTINEAEMKRKVIQFFRIIIQENKKFPDFFNENEKLSQIIYEVINGLDTYHPVCHSEVKLI